MSMRYASALKPSLVWRLRSGRMSCNFVAVDEVKGQEHEDGNGIVRPVQPTIAYHGDEQLV